MKLLNAEQLRQWDAYTIRNEPVSSLDLMERAASKCTQWIIDHNLADRAIKIFCGKGNNGGDGLAIARQLIEKDVHPEVYILEFGHKGTDDFQANLARLHRLTKHIHFIQQDNAFPVIHENDIVIDALFGSGLNRSPGGLTAALIDHINHSNSAVISIDVPSGMYMDSASPGNYIIKARHTLTFQCLKLCLLAAENSAYSGQVHVLDIGLHPRFSDETETDLHLTRVEELQKIYSPRDAFSHKGDFGHALIIGGAAGKAGAAIIATEACLRSGAGLTTVHLLNSDTTAINARCPEAMTMAGDELVKKNLSKFSAIAIGPGLGADDIANHLVSLMIQSFSGTLVIDADALNVLSQHKEWLRVLPAGSILTPHPKEFDRLFGEHTDSFARWSTALRLSQELGCTIVLKGHYTLIAHNGKGWFNTTGNAGLAKGGSGDALTGIIASLSAQGYTSFEAAMLGVYIHGLAADIAVTLQSYESLIASDVIVNIGNAFKKLSNVS